MADLTTIATQGHFGSVIDRIVAISTQGHFDSLVAESQLLQLTIDIMRRKNLITIKKRDIDDIEIEQSGSITIES
jgi:hypothetical protein